MEKYHSLQGGEPPPIKQRARDREHTLRTPDGDASVAHTEDTQADEMHKTADPSPSRPALMPDPAIEQARRASRSRAFDLLRKTPKEELERAMRHVHDKYNEAPIETLDDDLVGQIRALAGDDAEEEQRLIAGCKRYPYLRDWVRKPVGLSLSVPAPDFGRDDKRLTASGESSNLGTAVPANDADDRDPTAA